MLSASQELVELAPETGGDGVDVVDGGGVGAESEHQDGLVHPLLD